MPSNIFKSWTAAFILLSAIPLGAGTVAEEYLGEAVSMGRAHLVHGKFSRVELGANPAPVLDKALLGTDDGVALVRLKEGVSLELAKETEMRFSRDASMTYVELVKGAVRFSIPTGGVLGMLSGNEDMRVASAARYASLHGKPSVGESVGIMGMGGQGSFYVTALETPLVVTRLGKDEIAGPGETIVIAKAKAGSKGLLKGLTREQLGVISGQKGVKVVTGTVKAPKLAKGEVALAIPAEIGGGFIIGTADSIAAALSAAGITASVVSSAAVAAEAVMAGAGIGAGAWAAIGAAVVGGGALAAAGSDGGGGGSAASPVQ